MKLTELNKTQLIALWVTIGLLVLTFVFPPLKDSMIINIGSSTPGVSFTQGLFPNAEVVPGGYGFIGSAHAAAAGIDVQRIIIQCAVILVIAFGVFITLGATKKKQ